MDWVTVCARARFPAVLVSLTVVLLSAIGTTFPSAAAQVTAQGPGSEWPAGVTVVKDSPLSPRHGPAIVSTRTELIVFGGAKPSQIEYPERLLNDGAVLDVRTGEWTRIAAAPFDPPVVPAGVWTGRELVVLGSACVEEGTLEGELRCERRRSYGAVYSRADDAWRMLSVPPAFQRDGCCFTPLVWSGTEAIFRSALGYVSVNPDTGRLRRAPPEPPVPDANRLGATCVAGTHIVVNEFRGPAQAGRLVLLEAGSRRWTAAPEIPTDLYVAPDARPTCTNDSVALARDDLSSIVRYDIASREWSAVDAPILRPAFECTLLYGCDRYFVSGHNYVVDFWRPGQHGLRFDTRDQQWRRTTAGPSTDTELGQLVWAEGLAATYSSNGSLRRQLAIYNPTADSTPNQPNVLLNYDSGAIVAPGLNTHLDEEQPAWAQNPRALAERMVHVDQDVQATIDEHNGAGDQRIVEITVVVHGELRNAIRYQLSFEPAPSGLVRFVGGTWAQRCIGTLEFSTAACLRNSEFEIIPTRIPTSHWIDTRAADRMEAN